MEQRTFPSLPAQETRRRFGFNPAAATGDHYPGDGAKISTESHFELPAVPRQNCLQRGISPLSLRSPVQENIKKKKKKETASLNSPNGEPEG